MKFQTIIIGGGLSGLTAGISLSRAGHSVAIISAGQSALHFGSGTFELLSAVGGKEVSDPMKAIPGLPSAHPYSKIGYEAVSRLVTHVKPLMAVAGLRFNGSHTENHYRLTPLGKIKSGWLTLDDFATFPDSETLPWRKVALVNVKDFLDFYPQFIASGMAKADTVCSMHEITLEQLEHLRTSPTEMRAPNIARVLGDAELRIIADKVNAVAGDAEAVFMPAIFGLYGQEPVLTLRSMVEKPLYFISTMPTSVPGVRMQLKLRDYFKRSGGTYMLGDTVTGGRFSGSRLVEITTANHGDMPLRADNYVLATGSFFSHGLVAAPDRIYEPVFGLDVNASGDRAEWYVKDFYGNQPFMSYGVITDNTLRCRRAGATIDNLYAAGSVLGGCNPLKEGCGAGVSVLTAMKVAEDIVENSTSVKEGK